ncbi:hypothetical protein CF319_g8152 [Tilletia indica]|uniref:Uncharacterized protein n=1 Tax=Tilletia walkeri TaxID=117179 RepID=A0A8X7NBW5_9BASI|nr:hypothetical protein CF319_g8152 [Tilletia indica]KAE8269664.1 hypothetical protein A4X09_0g2678 [Tilletia walkeri]
MGVYELISLVYNDFQARADSAHVCQDQFERNFCSQSPPYLTEVCATLDMCRHVRLPTFSPRIVRIAAIMVFVMSSVAYAAYSKARTTFVGPLPSDHAPQDVDNGVHVQLPHGDDDADAI